VNDAVSNAGDTAVAVLMVNTGTPQAPTAAAVRAFLRSFLSDPRVIELPRLFWQPLLQTVVLPLRAPRSARKYRQIWKDEQSPLMAFGTQLRTALQRQLSSMRAGVRVEQAFLYSPPRVRTVLERLRADGFRRIVVLPLFPQSSGSSTGPVYDQVAAALRNWRALPHLRFVSNYHDDPDYIGALTESLTDHRRLHGMSGHVLFSFHGIPMSYVAGGDRYADECRQTAALLATAAGLATHDWSLTFQSRFGANRWLTPATDRTLAELPRRGIKAVTVMCPGFAVDCLETLEEIAISGREIFTHAGGERFDYVAALNARQDHAAALARLVVRAISDWPAPRGLEIQTST
jgi:protoporphyrin/coproporphyrin ferrochelatase